MRARILQDAATLRQALAAAHLLDAYRAEALTWLLSAKRLHRAWLCSLVCGHPVPQLKHDRNAYLSLVRALR